MSKPKKGKDSRFIAERGMITLSRNDLAASEFLILQAESLRWIQAVINYKQEDDNAKITLSDTDIKENLINGEILCKLLAKIEPNVIDLNKIHVEKTIPTKEMKTEDGQEEEVNPVVAAHSRENIALFLDGCRELGLKDAELFTTTSLFEGKNVLHVIFGIHNLSRKAHSLGIDIPEMKMLMPDDIDFSRAQLRKCQKILVEMGADITSLLSSSNERMMGGIASSGGQQASQGEIVPEEVVEKPDIAAVTEVSVTDPEKTYDEDKVLKDWWAYTSYMVKTVTPEKTFEIRRRYKDFMWLQEELLLRHPSADLPKLPEKRGVFEKIGDFIMGDDAEFIEERRQGLDDFLHNIIWNYSLRGDSATSMFLRESDKLIEDGFLWGFSKLRTTEEGE